MNALPVEKMTQYYMESKDAGKEQLLEFIFFFGERKQV